MSRERRSIFLALLAVAALSFVLVTSNRSRRLEFAVLRAMGFGVRPARLVVYWQATAIAVVGLVAGVPLGILVGRWMWQEVTTRVPLVYVPPSTSPWALPIPYLAPGQDMSSATDQVVR